VIWVGVAPLALAGAFLLGALWMYRRQRHQIRLFAEFLARATADLSDDLFDHLGHDDPDDDSTTIDAALAHPPAAYWPDMN
jgi:hypothetical protein